MKSGPNIQVMHKRKGNQSHMFVSQHCRCMDLSKMLHKMLQLVLVQLEHQHTSMVVMEVVV